MNHWEVDRAVFFVLAMRGWQLAAGVISMLVFAKVFNEPELGLYGMFSTLMGLHLFVELGLAVVAATIASHEWAHLQIESDGSIGGDPLALSRLTTLNNRLGRWYLWVSIVFTIFVGVAGYVFLDRRAPVDISWKRPWVALVLVSGPSLYWWSRIAILEGCNQLRVVNALRFWQAFVGNLVIWPALLLGAGLWAPAIAAGIRLLFDGWLVKFRFARFFGSLQPATTRTTESVSWSDEVWPLQWRIAIRSIGVWVTLQLFAPVLYEYHTDETGRFWLTWTALTAIEAAAFAWVQTRGPLFGMLIARRDYTELDRVFWRVSWISCAALLLGGTVAIFGTVLLPHVPIALGPKLAGMLLPPGTIAMFVVGMLSYNVVRCLGLYVQSHKRDPFLRVHILCCTATGLAVWWGGKQSGAWGEAVGYTIAITGGFLPFWIGFFKQCRREWQPRRDDSRLQTGTSDESTPV
ncbi:MAG: hypothetical protein ACK5Q5_00600 [Planctomycetaceae bacterium]